MFRGRICVIASQVGATLDYADDGKKLVDVIRDKWSDEFIAGHDFDILDGDSLREFKVTAGDTLPKWVSSTARLMVLYESGFDLVFTRTEKAAGRRLRRLLVDEVIPKLRRGETIGGELPPRQREKSLKGDLKRAKLIAKAMPYLPNEETRSVAAAYVLSYTTGRNVAPMLPELPNERWSRPTQIAEELGVSVAAVGKAITILGLRGHTDYSKEILDTKQDGGHVPCYLYNEAGVELIRKHFEANPWKPSKPKKKASPESVDPTASATASTASDARIDPASAPN